MASVAGLPTVVPGIEYGDAGSGRSSLERIFSEEVQKWGITILRVALGIVFLWFGALKIAGVSPVQSLVRTCFPFMPEPYFFMGLGVVEVLIGLGLITKVALRATLAVFLMQMGGTLTAPLFAPSLFFSRGNLLLLTTEGEFVVKNLVLIASGLVIGGYALKTMQPKTDPEGQRL